MNTAHRVLTALVGTGALLVIQYNISQPWRYLLGATEFIILAITVAILWGRTKELARITGEHRARLDAIAAFASKAQIVRDANRIVDAVTESLYVHQVQEAVDSTE